MKFRLVKIFVLCFFFFPYSFLNSASLKKDAVANAQQNIDSSSPRQVIIRFLQWYKTNMQKANSFNILQKDSAGNFMISKTACTNYLQFLKSSKCISSQYIAYWRTFFNDHATGLQNNPIQSDIPEGFDLDFVLITQEPDLVLDHISQAKLKTLLLNATDAVIGLSWPQKDGMQYQIEMHKNKEGWQIDYIATPNFD